MAEIEKIEYEAQEGRCQAVNSKGQCLNMAYKDSKFCLAHGGNKSAQAQEAKNIRNYQLAKWNDRLERFGNSDGIKSLRDEIGILRMMMEERLNLCNDAQDLVLQSGPISDLVMKIDKVVTSCHKLEGAMGQLLDKAALVQFAGEVISIIGDVLQGQEDKTDEIAERILIAMNSNEPVTE